MQKLQAIRLPSHNILFKMELSIPCPDGFLLSPDDPLRASHMRLNDYLLAEEQRPSHLPFDVAIWRKAPKRDFANQIQAVLLRLAWLDQHDAELENAHLSRIRLATLLRVLYSMKASYTEPCLRMLLDLTVPLLGRLAPYGPVERAIEYIRSTALTPGLSHSLRHFQATPRVEM